MFFSLNPSQHKTNPQTTTTNTMKMTPKPFMAAVLIAASALFTACTTLTTEQSTTAEVKPGVPGGKVSQTTQLKATVTAIDAAKRKVTLVTRHNEKFSVTAGPEVVNFPQIRIGDQLTVSYTESVVIRMAKPREKVVDDATADVKLAAEGKKPGLGVSTKGQVVATVSKIDTKSRKVTLQFSDGSSEAFKVRDDIDLAHRKVGERVVIQLIEAMAIKMEKP
jgi:Cu/Ag efflux protein CusF